MKASKNNYTSFNNYNFVITLQSWQGFAGDVLQVVLFTVLWFKWSVKKHCVAKVLLGIWETFLDENNRTIIPTDLVTNLLLSSLFFLTNQKQESGFQQLGGLVTRNDMTNLIDFYKGILLHVIPVRIIVPCFDLQKSGSSRWTERSY